MSSRTLYLVLAIVGAIVPWIFFADFFSTHGLAGDFVGSLFVNGAAGGFAADLLISSVVLWIFAFSERHKIGTGKLWLLVAINLLIGLSCALPLLLWMRQSDDS